LPATAYVLIQVQRHQLVGDSRSGLGIRIIKAHGKSDVGFGGAALLGIHHIGADHLEVHIASHSLEKLLARVTLALTGIEVETLDDLQQIFGRHHALADDLDPLVGIASDRRLHQIGGQFLLFDQNCAARAVGCRPQQSSAERDRQHGQPGD